MNRKHTTWMLIIMICLIILVTGFIIWLNQDMLTSSKDVKQVDDTGEVLIEEDGKVHNANLSAFLKDEDFFDKQTQTVEVEESKEPKVFMMVTSVEKDLRIKMVDEDNNIIEGYSFLTTLNGEQSFLDEDLDGVIYISDLKPGRYQVELAEMEGFDVSEAKVEAQVKSVVSYTIIEDISYLVHAESDIDVKEDDTREIDAQETDSDDSQYTNLLDQDTLEDAVSLGIDVSKWNGRIDWQAVKEDGVEFAIIRCGYRGSKTGYLVEDPYFWENLQGAKKAGLKVGLYFFTQAINVKEAVEEASTVVSLLGEEKIDYPIYIDVEGAGGNGRADGLDPVMRTAICSAFCKTITNAGFSGGVYSSRNWYYHNIHVEELEGYHIWLAEYRETPLYTGNYEMWQYTSSGSVNGIEGRVDLNVRYQ